VLWKIHIEAGITTLKMIPLLIIPLTILLVVSFLLIGLPIRVAEELLQLVTLRRSYIRDIVQVMKMLAPFQAFIEAV
jgi:hypothetical protein